MKRLLISDDRGMLITRCLQTPQPQRCGPQLGDNLPVATKAIEVRPKISRLSYLFLFAMASDSENIARERCLSFRIIEMDDRAVVFDQVDFLNAGNIIYCELLQSRLQFLVVGCGCLVDDLLLATWGTCKGKPVLVSLVQGAWLFIHFHANSNIDFGFSHFSPALCVVPSQRPTFSTDADKLSLSLQLL